MLGRLNITLFFSGKDDIDNTYRNQEDIAIVFAGTEKIGNTDDNQLRMMIIFPRKDNIDILIIITRK